MEKEKNYDSNIICIFNENGKEIENILNTIYEDFLKSKLEKFFDS